MRKVALKTAPLLWNGFKHQTFGFKLSGVEIKKYPPLDLRPYKKFVSLKKLSI